MKRFLITPLIFFSTFSIAQIPFIKVSPSFIATNEGNKTTAGFLSGGILLTNKTAIGLTGGYFRPNEVDKATIPIGIEFTYCDFAIKKTKPILSVNVTYPIYKKTYSYMDMNGNDFALGKITGIIMTGANAGIALPITEKQKIMITGGYSFLSLKSNYKQIPEIQKRNTGMYIFSIAGFL